MIAGDKQFTHSGGMIMRGKTKIYELPEHTAREIFHSKRLFVGFAGNVDDFAKAIQYFYTLDGKPPKCKNIEMLFLNDKRQIYHGTGFGNWLQIDEPHFAIGSGMQFAVAAMDSGKDPLEAIKIASKYDINTGKGFNKLEL